MFINIQHKVPVVAFHKFFVQMGNIVNQCFCRCFNTYGEYFYSVMSTAYLIFTIAHVFSLSKICGEKITLKLRRSRNAIHVPFCNSLHDLSSALIY